MPGPISIVGARDFEADVAVLRARCHGCRELEVRDFRNALSGIMDILSALLLRSALILQGKRGPFSPQPQKNRLDRVLS
jgi:hypothetical protein